MQPLAFKFIQITLRFSPFLKERIEKKRERVGLDKWSSDGVGRAPRIYGSLCQTPCNSVL